MTVLSVSAEIFACHSKACAPPPAGHGGSDLSKAHAAGEHGGESSATVHEGCKDCGDRFSRLSAAMEQKQAKHAADRLKRQRAKERRAERDAAKVGPYVLARSEARQRQAQQG